MKVKAPWNDWLAEPMSRDHLVHSYSDDRSLIEALSVYAGVGMGKGEAVVLVITPDHAASLRERLRVDGFDAEDLERWGQLRILDAQATLDLLLPDGQPEPHSFRTLCAALVSEARMGSRTGRVRFYGEMVNILCGRGQESAALALEQLWNEALSVHGMPLLCAYQVPAGRTLAAPLAHAHTHVVPSNICA